MLRLKRELSGLSAEFSQLQSAAGPERQGPIDLAQEPSFQVGELTVAPALREVTGVQGERQSLEPRVMQVLVALARAKGTIVSRDELIRLYWRGMIVGEDAINRTISLLRRVAKRIGRESFRIETVPRVGYRLVVPPDSPASLTTALEAPPATAGTLPPKLLWPALVGMLAVGAGALTIWSGAPSSPTYSVSVQPFRTSGAAPSFDAPRAAAAAASWQHNKPHPRVPCRVDYRTRANRRRDNGAGAAT